MSTTMSESYASRHRVDAEALVSSGIYEQEYERIFSRTWNFLAHESELPNRGDFVVRYIGADSLILVRGEDGVIRCFYNVCRHRGMQVCRADLGNAKRFTCPYHGWLYSNEGKLVSVPLDKPFFGTSGLDRQSYPLRPLERIESFYGLIFGCRNAEVEPLEDFLGDFAWYLKIHLARDPDGLQVIGEPQRWIFGANWKIGAENFAGDSYHAGYLHRSVMEVGFHPNTAADFTAGGRRNGVHIAAGAGTMALARQTPQERGYPADMVRMFRQSLPEQQRALIFGDQPFWPTRGYLFPNVSMLNAGACMEQGHVVPFLNWRIWRPIGPESVEVWSWVLAERSASQTFKRDSMRAYVLTFGTAGTEEVDDVEVFMATTTALRGAGARRIDQLLLMDGDLRPEWQVPDWPGPGRAIGTAYSDAGQRQFWDQWSQALGYPDANGQAC
jgi:phenylpropionate dioxygenase-like ring-hydroxylating dioxygenase large terminal subunit